MKKTIIKKKEHDCHKLNKWYEYMVGSEFGMGLQYLISRYTIKKY